MNCAPTTLLHHANVNEKGKYKITPKLVAKKYLKTSKMYMLIIDACPGRRKQ